MSTRNRLDLFFASLAVMALVALPFVSGGSSESGETSWGAETFRVLANTLHVLLLAAAAAAAWGTASLLPAGNPARLPWRLLGAGLAAFLAAETVDGWYEIVLRSSRPFPSAVDLLFVGAYVLVVPTFLLFVRAYHAPGDEVGSAMQHLLIVLGGGLGLAAVGFLPMRAVLLSPASFAERVVGAAYLLLDFAVLALALVLLRITVAFRGGHIWRVWVLLLTGFLFTCVADVLFAFLSAGGVTVERSLMEALYLLSYLAIARGALEQYGLLAR